MEWTRHRREFGNPLSGRPITLVVLVALGLALGWLGHSLGRGLAAGEPFPDDVLGLLASAGFGWLVWRSSQYTRARFERLEPDLLLTTVPARSAALGLLGFVYVRLLIALAVPTLGLAVGTAIGLRSPTTALSVVVAVAGVATLAVAVGTAGRLAARYVALHLVRVRFYRDLLVVFGWLPLVAVWWVLQETSVSLGPLVGVFGALPVAWFVDLAFVGGADPAFGSGRRAFGALGLLVPAVPVLAAVTAVLARRIWESEPISSTGTHGSHSLIEEGLLERFVGERVPRPVYTVARERWLVERRVPRGLLSTGYVLCFVGVFGFPLLLFGGPNGLLLVVAVSLGAAAGIAFASDPIGTEYRTLPMLFTTVDGRQFVGGLLLAALLVGTPLVLLVTLPLGLVSVVGTVQSVLIALVGVASCACTASVAIAVGLGVDRYEFVPAPFFFTDVPIYAEPGSSAFLRLGSIFVTVSLANVPAFAGNAPPVYERLAAAGVPVFAVQVGSLLVALLLVVAVTGTASRIAVRRFQAYQIR